MEIEMESVDGEGFGGGGDGELGWGFEKEYNVGVLGGVWVVGDEAGEFGMGAEEGGGGEQGGEGGGVGGGGGKDDVAGLDVGADVFAAGGRAEAGEFDHGEFAVAADVDSAEQGEVG